MRIATKQFVYSHLVCEFDHWDYCLAGLLRIDGAYWYCQHTPTHYDLWPIAWNAACEAYLADYRRHYNHWCYYDGKRPEYDGRPLGNMRGVWGNPNPIELAIVKE